MTDVLTPPFDVRLMNLTASVLFVAVACMGLASGLWWALRHPAFAIGGITVQGDLVHNSAVTLRANVMPRLTGNFFTLDLGAARAAFQDVPWVRRAVVRREFPNRLRVELQEHVPVAFWGAEGDSRLLNGFGEVFEANMDDLQPADLPRLNGPDGQARQVLETFRTLEPAFASAGFSLEQFELTARGGWRAQMEDGAVIELGRGEVAELAARVARFTRTVTQVVARHGRTVQALESADLRHSDGYAVRIRGVTTGVTEDLAKARNRAAQGHR
jgi:cell division protein FtsQ